MVKARNAILIIAVGFCEDQLLNLNEGWGGGLSNSNRSNAVGYRLNATCVAPYLMLDAVF